MHPRFRTLIRYVEDELASGARARVAKHLLVCGGCRGHVDALTRGRTDIVDINDGPSPELAARIEVSRARGVDVVIADGGVRTPPSRRRTALIVMTGAAAILLALVVPLDSNNGEDCMRRGIGKLLPVTIFGAAVACADEPMALPDSAYRAVDAVADVIRPGRYTYTKSMWTDDLVESPQGMETFVVSESEWAGQRALLVVEDRTFRYARPRHDTTIIMRDSLIMVRRVATDVERSSFQEMVATGDTVRLYTGLAGQSGEFVRAWRGTALMQSAPLTFMRIMGLPLTAGWAGTFRGLQYRVVARETVTVPAGTFDTWRVEVVGERSILKYWVAVDQPLVVKSESGTVPDRWEIVLASVEGAPE